MSNPHFAAATEHRPQLVSEDTANEGYLAEEGVTDETMQFSALNRIAEATLALAYEQKTANLLSVLNLPTGNISDWTPEMIDDYTKRTDEIATRLGHGDTK